MNSREDILVDTIDVLKASRLFIDITDQELAVLVNLSKITKVPKNAMVITEEDETGSIYFIKEGSVRVFSSREEEDQYPPKEVTFSSLRHQGDHFGELSLLDGEPRSTNVIATKRCEFIVINQNDFHLFLSQHGTVAINMIKYLCSQVRHLTENIEILALDDVYGRLIKLLHDLAVPDESGELVVEIPLTHNEIAQWVGASREMISKILKELVMGGYLSVENQVFTIKKTLPLTW